MLQLQKLDQHGQCQACNPDGLQYKPVLSPWATSHQNGYGSMEGLRGAHCCNLFSRPSLDQYEAAVIFLANGAVQPAVYYHPNGDPFTQLGSCLGRELRSEITGLVAAGTRSHLLPVR